MDIDEWEYLPDDGFLDFSEDGEKQVFLGKRILESKSDFDTDYFCPSPQSSRKIITEPTRNQRVPNQLVPLPIPLEPRIGNAQDDGLVKEITKNHPMEVTIVTPSVITKKIKDSQVAPTVEVNNHDTVSQVFFKMKENEFVDMKMDTSGLKFDDKGEAKEIITSPRKKVEKEMLSMECDKEEGKSTWEEEEEENHSGLNVWKWSLTGVGAICSFGVAAATICVLFFGSQQRKKQQQLKKIRLQIYTDEKSIRQVVQHVPNLDEAISVVGGVPVSRAHITIGGYYDSL